MLFMLLQACQKEVNPTISEYKIQEYFAPEGTDVKQTIIDFLYAAGRINHTAAKSENATLTDKDPNEGAWLMEAAINLERYNDFSEATTYKKEFTLEVANKVLPDGIIKMDANDIIAKYSDLLAAIVAEETGGKIAKLIDIKIEYVTADYTGLSVVALFGGGNNDIGAPWEPENESGGYCNYLYEGIFPSNYIIDWDEDFSYISELYSNGIFSANLSDTYIYNIGGHGYFFNLMARKHIYWNPPIYQSPTPTIVLNESDQGLVYYTNIIIKSSSDIENLDMCPNIVGDFPIVSSPEYLDDYIRNYHEMIYRVEASLPNSIQIEFRPVYGLVRGGRRSYAQGISIEYIGFVRANSL